MEQKNPVESFICKACKLEKPSTKFYRNKNCVSGFHPRCKMCMKTGIKINQGPKKKSAFSTKARLTLRNPEAVDYIDTFLFLEKIGYDLTKDIHIQFCEKYNLTPNNPIEVFNNSYKPHQLFS